MSLIKSLSKNIKSGSKAAANFAWNNSGADSIKPLKWLKEKGVQSFDRQKEDFEKASAEKTKQDTVIPQPESFKSDVDIPADIKKIRELAERQAVSKMADPMSAMKDALKKFIPQKLKDDIAPEKKFQKTEPDSKKPLGEILENDKKREKRESLHSKKLTGLFSKFETVFKRIPGILKNSGSLVKKNSEKFIGGAREKAGLIGRNTLDRFNGMRGEKSLGGMAKSLIPSFTPKVSPLAFAGAAGGGIGSFISDAATSVLGGVAGGGLLAKGKGLIKGGISKVGGLFGKGGGGGLLAKEGGKLAAKSAGKSLLKKIPGVGLLAGLGFGAQRAMAGDWEGAGAEGLSGLLSMAPGPGTAASLAVDAGLAARDMGELEKKKQVPVADVKKVENQIQNAVVQKTTAQAQTPRPNDIFNNFVEAALDSDKGIFVKIVEDTAKKTTVDDLAKMKKAEPEQYVPTAALPKPMKSAEPKMPGVPEMQSPTKIPRIGGPTEPKFEKPMKSAETIKIPRIGGPNEDNMPFTKVSKMKNNSQQREILEKQMSASGIVDPTERAMMLAQLDHESNLKAQSENLNYTSVEKIKKTFGKNKGIASMSDVDIAQLVKNPEALANVVYADKNRSSKGKMGNTEEGDGYKFRGRGMIQITGKENYEKYGNELGVDLVNNPDMANDPEVAAKIAVAFWKKNNLSRAAKAGDVGAVTQTINGGQNGIADREAKFAKYKAEIGVQAPFTVAKSAPKADDVRKASDAAMSRPKSDPIIVPVPMPAAPQARSGGGGGTVGLGGHMLTRNDDSSIRRITDSKMSYSMS